MKVSPAAVESTAFTFTASHLKYSLILDKCVKIFGKNNVKFISRPTLSEDKKALVCFLKDPNNEFYIELVEQINS